MEGPKLKCFAHFPSDLIASFLIIGINISVDRMMILYKNQTELET
jgi:hypothetical protein